MQHKRADMSHKGYQGTHAEISRLTCHVRTCDDGKSALVYVHLYVVRDISSVYVLFNDRMPAVNDLDIVESPPDQRFSVIVDQSCLSKG